VIVGVPLRLENIDIAEPGRGVGLGLGGPSDSSVSVSVPSASGAVTARAGRRRPCDDDAKSGTETAGGARLELERDDAA
jgi:hypothetical protein